MADKKVILKNERYADDSQFWCPECHILMQYKYAGKFVCEKCVCKYRSPQIKDWRISPTWQGRDTRKFFCFHSLQVLRCSNPFWQLLRQLCTFQKYTGCFYW